MPAQLLARYANRRGLIAGPTGTGTTVTLPVPAENFSQRICQNMPVFMADVKGDIAGPTALFFRTRISCTTF
ncbi:MAG: helicase HerA-like domain-containing protein [Desulfobulbus sp.]